MSTAATAPDIHPLSSFRQWPSSSSSSSTSTRSHLSSLSTTSSLSSTFSDVSVASVPSVPPPSPPQVSKTSAFFASPFSTRPPSPPLPPSPPRSLNNKPRSLTADFFATKTASEASVVIPENLPPPSRLFPSRFTSIAQRASPPSPPSLELDQDLQPETPSRQTTRNHHIPSLILNANDSSGSRSTPIVIDVNEPTPRPPSRIPAALDTTVGHAIEIPHDTASTEPEPGTIISSATGIQNRLSPSPSQPHFSPISIPETEVNIRLIRALGHGAFSSVWLAEDLSSTPLTLASKRSLRELKWRASGLLSRNSSLRSPSRLSLRDGTSTPSRAPSIHEPSDPFTTSPTDLEFADKPGEFAVTTAAPSLSYDPSHSTSCSPSACISRAGSVKSSVSRSGSTNSTASSIKRKLRSLTDGGGSKLIAVKMTSRNGGLGQGPEADRERERTRAGFVREVEVLRHIAHPNITALLASLTTATHHIIVLPYLPGGDLLSLVNNDVAWSKFGEDVLKRIWCELCKAVGWMHSVGIVHRDIKLENILLTTQVFLDLDSHSPRPTLDSLPPPPLPVIKLTDFGLARFIDVTPSSPPPPAKLELGDHSFTAATPSPSSHFVSTFNSNHSPGSPLLHRRPATKARHRTLLSTRCGSEAYAAPELVMGGGGSRGIYDARETDAWACGVVLYALIGRKLPFGEGVSALGAPGARIGGEPARASVATGRAERRAWLMRIARGEWVWPVHERDEHESHVECQQGGSEILVGPRLVESEGARGIVERLLVRDPRKRMMVSELWDDEWMQGVGIGPSFGNNSDTRRDGSGSGDVFSMDEDSRSLTPGRQHQLQRIHHPEQVSSEEESDDMFEEDDDEFEDDEGWLVDEEGIQSIAREEVV